MEMDGRKHGGLQFVNKIYDDAVMNRDEEEYYDKENIVRALVNPKFQLSEQEIKDEIAGIILAVST